LLIEEKAKEISAFLDKNKWKKYVEQFNQLLQALKQRFTS
jgi:hypothetical protein